MSRRQFQTLRRARRTSQSRFLLLLFAGLHGRFRRLKTDSRVGTVTEGFIHRPAATAERERGFACEVVGIAVAVDQLDPTFGGFYTIRTVLADRNLDLGHGILLEESS